MLHIHILSFLLGLILLVKGSDYFVSASSRIAKKFGVSEFVIGLTLVAFGTSIPELASSIVASINNYSGIVIGNIVGSNIANIGLIIGLSALVATIKSNRNMLERDGYIMIFSAIIFYIFALNGILSRTESIVLLFLYLAYIMFLLKSKPSLKASRFKEFLNYFMRMEYLLTIKDTAIRQIIKKRHLRALPYYKKRIYSTIYKSFKSGLIRDFLIITFSIVAIIYGAEYLVNGAVWIANYLKIPSNIIALSVIAVGTSLPELGVSISAVKRGFGDILIGNILGSNIVNILLIIGTSALINPLEITKITLYYTAPFMLFISLLLLIFIRTKWRIKKIEGAVLLLLYLLFIVFIFAYVF